jgi:hypothetical protein
MYFRLENIRGDIAKMVLGLSEAKRERIGRTNKQKLRGPSAASELYRQSDRHLSTKFSVSFCG